MRILFNSLRVLVCLVLSLFVLYWFGAIYFDGPLGQASVGNLILGIAWLVLIVVIWLVPMDRRLKWGGFAAAICLVAIPWLIICPSNDRDWKPEFGETGWAEVEGDKVTFHNYRHFAYVDGEEIPKWESRTFHLSNLKGADLFFDAFGGDLLAHPIISFDFGDEGNVCLSVETRREVHESFSALGGLYKMFELQYIFGEESDFIGVRTRVRNEPVYLYRFRTSRERVEETLMESIQTHNELKDKPRFYNVLTSNCTTSLRAQTPSEMRAKFDWRMLVNGYLDQYLFEKGAIETAGLSFVELRPRVLINEAANRADDPSKFSTLVRRGRPGFQ